MKRLKKYWSDLRGYRLRIGLLAIVVIINTLQFIPIEKDERLSEAFKLYPDGVNDGLLRTRNAKLKFGLFGSIEQNAPDATLYIPIPNSTNYTPNIEPFEQNIFGFSEVSSVVVREYNPHQLYNHIDFSDARIVAEGSYYKSIQRVWGSDGYEIIGRGSDTITELVYAIHEETDVFVDAKLLDNSALRSLHQ